MQDGMQSDGRAAIWFHAVSARALSYSAWYRQQVNHCKLYGNDKIHIAALTLVIAIRIPSQPPTLLLIFILRGGWYPVSHGHRP